MWRHWREGLYDAVEMSHSTKSSLTSTGKQRCVELLHCHQHGQQSLAGKQYRTCTSHWNTLTCVSSAACSLLKILPWHLLDEQYLFDPLKQNNDVLQLPAETVLWPNIDEANKHDKFNCAVSSLDAILHSNISGKQLGELQHLDALLFEVDYNDCIPVKPTQASHLADLLDKSKSSVPVHMRKPYKDFTNCLCEALIQQGDCNTTIKEVLLQRIFIGFVNCILACVDGEDQFRVDRDIDDATIGRVLLETAVEGGEDIHMEISSEPDVLICEASFHYTIPQTLIAVVKAKGMTNQPDSVDEGSNCCQNGLHNIDDSDDQGIHQSTKKPKCQNPLHTRTKVSSGLDLKGEDEGEIFETDLEELIKTVPPHLQRTTKLPPAALRDLNKFLPQLIGDMWCCSRSGNVRWFSGKDGLKFGVGLFVFDVYFVTMMDSCISSSKSDVLDNADYTNIFVTRPFNLLSKRDRRTIIKTLVAALFLDTYKFTDGKD